MIFLIHYTAPAPRRNNISISANAKEVRQFSLFFCEKQQHFFEPFRWRVLGLGSSWPGQCIQLAGRFGNDDPTVTTSTRRPGYFWPAGGGLTWLGFGFAPRLPFNLGGGGFVGLGSRLFALLAALAHPPPGAAGHQQGRGRLSACKGSTEPTGCRVNVWWESRKETRKKTEERRTWPLVSPFAAVFQPLGWARSYFWERFVFFFPAAFKACKSASMPDCIKPMRAALRVIRGANERVWFFSFINIYFSLLGGKKDALWVFKSLEAQRKLIWMFSQDIWFVSWIIFDCPIPFTYNTTYNIMIATSCSPPLNCF